MTQHSAGKKDGNFDENSANQHDANLGASSTMPIAIQEGMAGLLSAEMSNKQILNADNNADSANQPSILQGRFANEEAACRAFDDLSQGQGTVDHSQGGTGGHQFGLNLQDLRDGGDPSNNFQSQIKRNQETAFPSHQMMMMYNQQSHVDQRVDERTDFEDQNDPSGNNFEGSEDESAFFTDMYPQLNLDFESLDR